MLGFGTQTPQGVPAGHHGKQRERPKSMARVLKMPEKRRVYYCPVCGTPKIEFESEHHIGPNLATFPTAANMGIFRSLQLRFLPAAPLPATARACFDFGTERGFV